MTARLRLKNIKTIGGEALYPIITIAIYNSGEVCSIHSICSNFDYLYVCVGQRSVTHVFINLHLLLLILILALVLVLPTFEHIADFL